MIGAPKPASVVPTEGSLERAASLSSAEIVFSAIAKALENMPGANDRQASRDFLIAARAATTRLFISPDLNGVDPLMLFLTVSIIFWCIERTHTCS